LEAPKTRSSLVFDGSIARLSVHRAQVEFRSRDGTKFEGTKAARCSFYRVVLENRRGSVNSGQRPMRCAPEAQALRQQTPVQ
jgi:hypothetical protein